MSLNRKESVINKIKNAFASYNDLIKKYKAENYVSIAAWQMETVPPELTASFNILSLKVPSFLRADKDMKEYWSHIADTYIAADNGCLRTVPDSSASLYNFKIPAGYGEEAAVSIHNETSRMLHSLFNADLKKIDIDTLKEKTGIYENLRKSVRGICSLRNSSPSLLTQSELSMIFETALIFPPETALEYITPVFEFCKEYSKQEETSSIRAMLFSCGPFKGETADLIENEGILITEDDTSSGRRSFDISLDNESDYLFYELLDAYSYRPYAPPLRSPEERYELLYKLLKNYGIELVIFIELPELSCSQDIINYLRIKCMRNGVDVISASADESPARVRNYLTRAGLQ
jgi:benzoyl-CoA reductase/2-hydroxyglutaryl-CoA dehydratase subunit BcrC/BadD/HgdB